MAPLTSKGNSKGCGGIGTALVIIGGYAFYYLAWVFLYCCWYRLLYMLLLLLMLMDYLLAGFNPKMSRFDRPRVVDRIHTQLRHHSWDAQPFYLFLLTSP